MEFSKELLSELYEKINSFFETHVCSDLLYDFNAYGVGIHIWFRDPESKILRRIWIGCSSNEERAEFEIRIYDEVTKTWELVREEDVPFMLNVLRELYRLVTGESISQDGLIKMFTDGENWVKFAKNFVSYVKKIDFPLTVEHNLYDLEPETFLKFVENHVNPFVAEDIKNDLYFEAVEYIANAIAEELKKLPDVRHVEVDIGFEEEEMSKPGFIITFSDVHGVDYLIITKLFAEDELYANYIVIAVTRSTYRGIMKKMSEDVRKKFCTENMCVDVCICEREIDESVCMSSYGLCKDYEELVEKVYRRAVSELTKYLSEKMVEKHGINYMQMKLIDHVVKSLEE